MWEDGAAFKGRAPKVAGGVRVGFTWHVVKGDGKCTPIFSGIRVTLILRKKLISYSPASNNLLPTGKE